MIERSFERLSRFASGFALAIGGGALLSWLFAVAALMRGAPGLVTIKVNTALSLLLLGTALWRMIVPNPAPPKPWLARACIALTIALAGSTLLEYALALDLGIDELLVHEARGALETASPGRMAPNTAIYLLALSGALAWLDARSAAARALSQALATVALGGGFAAGVGYLLHVRALYGVTGYTAMALHTALALCALALGVLCARPQRGWFAAFAQDNAAGAAARRLIPRIALVPPAVGWLRLQGERAGYYRTESGLALTITITCGALVVLVLRHARQQGLAERARWQAAQDERFLLGLSELLRTASLAAAVLPDVARSLGTYLKASRCFFSEVDAARDRFVIHNDFHALGSSLAGTMQLSSLQPEGLADGHTAVAHDTRTDPKTASRYETGYRPVGIRARVAVPLRREGRWVGLLVVTMHEPRRWETREVALIEATAERAWAWAEQLAAAHAVREREQDLAVTMDSIAEALITTDRDGRIQRMNPVAERLTGWRFDEARARPLAEVFRTQHETPPAPSSLVRALQGEGREASAQQTVLLGRDGSSTPIDEDAAPIIATDGTTRGMVVVFRDVSARKQAELDRQFVMELAELRHAASDAPDLMFKLAERLAGYLKVERSMFCDVDVEQGRFVVARDYHRDGPALRGSYVLESFGSETIVAHRAGRTTAIDDTSTDPRTAQQFHAAYEPLGIRARVAVPLIREQRWVGVLSIASALPRVWQAREVALLEAVAERAWLWIEQARLAAALREQQDNDLLRRSEERFRTLVEGVKEYAIFRIDPTGHIATWNRGAARLKGYTEAEIIGQHFSVFYPASDNARGHPQELLDRALRDGRCEEQGWRVRQDGSQFWADTVLTPLYDPSGVLEGFAKVTRDYTERRQADEQLRERQAQLTASLKEREVLLQEVHHRVKNNLQVISSLINMQKRQMRDADGRRGLDECKARVEAIALIHEKLYQAKNYASIPFSEYARSLADNIFDATGMSPSNVVLKVDIESIALAVDRAIPCGLILNELISNALKHAFPDERQGAVHVELRRQDADLLLAVGDDGVGMPTGFDLEKSESLGLQLVTTLVEQLQARLEIVQHGGTTFRITFPWRQAS